MGDTLQTNSPAEPTWQCLLICWGTKYGAKDIMHLHKTITRSSANPPHFVLLTDRDRPELGDAFEQVPFPAFYNKPEFKKAGCQAKLAMFAPGVLNRPLPTLFLDLDMLVFRDIERAFDSLKSPTDIAMIQTSLLPFSAAGRLLYRLTKGRVSARGNGSAIAFYPTETTWIDAAFREAMDEATPNSKPLQSALRADDRFVSWIANKHVRRFHNTFAVKFATEFMLNRKWLTRLKSAWPGVAARRDNISILSMTGEISKIENLIELKDGDVIKDPRGRYLIWEDSVLGETKGKILAAAQEMGLLEQS